MDDFDEDVVTYDDYETLTCDHIQTKTKKVKYIEQSLRPSFQPPKKMNKSFFGYKNITDSLSLCRTTAYTSKYFKRFTDCLPAFKRINDIYKSLVPIHYKNQKKAILKIDPEYVIKDTIFTTVTVNKNFRTALHKDSGDYKRGFGNLVVCSEGQYNGGYTLFPQYGIGIDCRNGDFLAMNVHEWHCNSAITAPKDSPQGTRMSFVLYQREKMINLCPLLN
jgi:hypothetical protein